LSNLDLVFDDCPIPPVDYVRNLGVIFDANMSMVKHVNQVCSTAFYHLYNISKIRQFLDRITAERIIHAFVTTRLDYCNSLLFGIPDYLINKLQRVQNSAARLITRNNKFCHITPVLFDLHWLPIKHRIQFKILVLTYKSLNGLAPAYLSALLSHRKSARPLRSSDELLLSVPRVKLVTAGQRAFAHAAPSMWNALPFTIRASPSIDIFKSGLKTHLFLTAFH